MTTSLAERQATEVNDLTRENNVGERYVAQLIKLAFLSPDIIRRVFKGNLRQDLTLGKLKANFDIRGEMQCAPFQLPAHH